MSTDSNSLDNAVRRDVAAALAEDIGPGDLTAKLIPAGKQARAMVRSREAAVLCGAPWFTEVFRRLDPQVLIEWQVAEGDALQPDREFVQLSGNAAALLSGERRLRRERVNMSALSAVPARKSSIRARPCRD